jgi:hypothetical protein
MEMTADGIEYCFARDDVTTQLVRWLTEGDTSSTQLQKELKDTPLYMSVCGGLR